jgi:hypothetical protein
VIAQHPAEKSCCCWKTLLLVAWLVSPTRVKGAVEGKDEDGNVVEVLYRESHYNEQRIKKQQREGWKRREWLRERECGVLEQ